MRCFLRSNAITEGASAAVALAKEARLRQRLQRAMQSYSRTIKYLNE